MAFNADVYRILIASPSDVAEDRDIIEKAIHDWNNLYAQKEKTVILPVRWETHSAPSMGDRAQGIINEQFVKDCDLLIGLFWTRIGTHTGVAESGTVEEIEYFIQSGKPVMLYFSDKQTSLSEVDFDQVQRVQAFRKRTIPNGLIEGYKTTIEFREKIRNQLALTMQRVIDGSAAPTEQRVEAAHQSVMPILKAGTLYIEDYNAKSFLVKGNTSPLKDELKAMGGRWNKTLQGWVFPMPKKIELTEFVKKRSVSLNKAN